MKEKIRIAVQKNGRLNKRSIELIKQCGIDYTVSNGQLKASAENFPLEILFLRDDDIPRYVSDGVADSGIVGLNVVKEKETPVEVIKKLGYACCRLSIAIPRSISYNGIKDLNSFRIASSHPNILRKYLEESGLISEIHEIKGSVEIAPAIGLTDAVCDLVSSGSTLLSNGLKEVEVILRSEAVLVSRKDLPESKRKILKKLLLRINAVLKADDHKYILLNAPVGSLAAIRDLLPGMKSPTISPLAESGWVSVQSVVREDEFWEIVEKLNIIGAEGILVMPIEKMVF